jgi:hypothetical protein
MLDWVAGRPVRLARRIGTALLRFVDSPWSRAFTASVLMIAVAALTWAAAKRITVPADAVRGVPERALTAGLVVTAALFVIVQWRASAREARAARDARLERYCRTFAASRNLAAAAKYYRVEIRNRAWDDLADARSRIRSLMRR